MMDQHSLATILLVDDNVELLRNLAFLLDVIGFDVLTACNGAEALQTLNNHTPDLIISDIDMPIVNGYDLLRALRGDPHWAKLPFVFASLRYRMDDLMFGLDLGATDYMPKPFDIYDVLDVIQRNLPNLENMMIHPQAS